MTGRVARAGSGARAWSRAAIGRATESLPALLQISAAATAAYSIARFGLGHPMPIFASAVAINALGFSRDARPIRVAETAIGITLGIVLADLLLLGIGRGWWQLFVVLVVTFFVARLLSASPGFAAAAGVQSSLVTLFPVDGSAELSRAIDGVIGGLVALAFTALVPRDPRRQMLRDARRVFRECSESLASLSTALRLADVPGADRTLERLRNTQPLVDAWAGTLDSAIAVARISPFFRRHHSDLIAQRRVLRGMDLVCRNLRIITRRVDFLIRDGRPRPQLADLIAQIGNAVALLGRAQDDRELADLARRELEVIAPRLDLEESLPDAGISEGVVLMLLRPLVVDLLTAAGLDEDEARRRLPTVE
ncbi:MAG: FUSC family protein [Naasia sp.]